MKKEPDRADFECFQDFGREKEEENEQLSGAGTDGNDLYLNPYRFCAV